MTTLYKIVSEWDFGLEDFIFTSPENAWSALLDNENFLEFLDESGYTIKELKDQNLIGITTKHQKGE